jgi:uncharacterized protein (TIGR00730 family)
MRVCVFCSSSDVIHQSYKHAARALGVAMARRGHELVFGGGRVGLMGVVSQHLRESGGRSTGVIPRFMHSRGVGDSQVSELVVTGDMRERKAEMERRADGFLVLPGGFGTCEEVLEIITLKQLRRHDKAVVFLNTRGYFRGLLRFFDHIFQEGFASPAFRRLYDVAVEPEEALDLLEDYRGSDTPDKFTTLTPQA